MSVSRECDHTRAMFRNRGTAITVCRNCRDYLCSICGGTIDWHAGLYVTNPPVQWRYCAKGACIGAEAAYHNLPVEEMIRCRSVLRAKRVLVHFQDRGIEPRPYVPPPESSGSQSLLRPERVLIASRPFVLDPGEACWCNLGKDCLGNHEIFIADPVHVCGMCGETFEISKTDPHWSTGRGPICPTPGNKARRATSVK
jgi:hypothetical protein